MAVDTGGEQRRQGPGKPFQRGQSGNPSGRRPGARNRTSALALKLMDADAEPDKGRQGRRHDSNPACAGAGGAIASQPSGAIRHAGNRNR
jgi:hypothetical protein